MIKRFCYGNLLVCSRLGLRQSLSGLEAKPPADDKLVRYSLLGLEAKVRRDRRECRIKFCKRKRCRTSPLSPTVSHFSFASLRSQNCLEAMPPDTH